MLVILLIGVLVDTFVFTQLDRVILRRRGLVACRYAHPVREAGHRQRAEDGDDAAHHTRLSTTQ